MTDREQENAAWRYLLAPSNAFWRWGDGGRVVEWHDGKTIVFGGELEAVLEQLAPEGLPPFSALILLLAATRDNWSEATAQPALLAESVYRWVDEESANDLQGILSSVLGKLDRIHLMERDVRSSPQAKATLCEVAFSFTARTKPDVARKVVKLLRQGLGEAGEQSRSEKDGGGLWRSIQCLDAALDQLSADELRRRRKTGLSELPLPAPVELPAADRVRSLLKEIADDDQLCGLGRLAQQLMAAVTLPRGIKDFDELQIGGVSDITNRGPLDRLLLSELAHDDLTLAVRVAVNEAMYLRRESPPRTPPRERSILIDSGLCSWGVPRVFSTAVAMAVIATTDNEMDVSCFRPSARVICPIDLTSHAGLEQHLAMLELELHPGEALTAFAERLDGTEDSSEPLLIMSQEVYDNHEFQDQLNQCSLAAMHVATVERDGSLRLLQRSGQATRVLRTAKLDLDVLFSTPERTRDLQRDDDFDLPAIFYIQPFPLLMPHNIDASQTWRIRDDMVLSVTTDRRLMLWQRLGWGARQLADDIPPGKVLWRSYAPAHQTMYAVVGDLSRGSLYLLNIGLESQTCTHTSLDLQVQACQGVGAHNGALFVVGGKKSGVDIFALANGARLGNFQLPESTRWIRGRFFVHIEGWSALSFDGVRAYLDPVLDSQNRESHDLVTMFERPDVDGAIGVTRHGELFHTATGRLRDAGIGRIDATRIDVSTDGTRVTLTDGVTGRVMFSDLDGSSSGQVRRNPMLTLERYNEVARPEGYRNRFTSIGRDERGKIRLISQRGGHFIIDIDYANTRIFLSPTGVAFDRPEQRAGFVSVSGHEGGFRLSEANWRDGNRAVLDSRGLLHLISSDLAIPQLTIVLQDGQVSGWCSDGRVWGRPYFIGASHDADRDEVFASITAFGALLP